jgi:hypothetical protein
MPVTKSKDYESPIYVGIDPGMAGGIAAVGKWGKWTQAIGMPALDKEVWEQIKAWSPRVAFAILEKVNTGFPGTGKSQMAKLYGSYTGLRMTLVIAGIPFEEVLAQRWQKFLHIPPREKSEPRNHFKNRLKVRAQQLFPREEVTLYTADALLIAEYCRRNHKEDSNGSQQ